MVVDSLQKTPTATAPKSDAEKAGLNYDAFLQLMLAQLKSQDPLNPVDQTQSLAQLAQFTNVEQAIKLNDKLDRLLKQSSTAEAAALLGKQVETLDRSVSGEVKAVELGSSGAVAVLANGARLPVADGLRIAAS